MPGVPLYEWGHRSGAAAKALPVDEGPFSMGLDCRLADARALIDAGLVDESDFDAERLGQTAEQVWFELLRNFPSDEDLVVTHGDFTLDNILVETGGTVIGCIDWGRAGVADRYQDLALVVRNLEEDFGLGAVFLREYGLREKDERKLLFDEFF